MSNNKRLVIVGATGMVGGYALRYALEHPAITSVTAIGRRELGISHPKLTEVLHRDFNDCSFTYRILRAIYPVFQTLFPNQVIRADDLARAMVDVVVLENEQGPVFENSDIRAMVESLHPASVQAKGRT